MTTVYKRYDVRSRFILYVKLALYLQQDYNYVYIRMKMLVTKDVALRTYHTTLYSYTKFNLSEYKVIAT